MNAQAAAAPGWQTASLLEARPYAASYTQLAMSPNGDAIAVWVQYDGTSNSLYASRFSEGAWGPATLIETSSAAVESPQIAMDKGGNATAVWLQSYNGYSSVYANRYSALSGSWGTAVLIETINVNLDYPDVGMDDNGNAMVIWDMPSYTSPTSYSNTIYCSLFSSTLWAWGSMGVVGFASTLIDSSGAPNLAMDGSGNAVVVWSDRYHTNDYFSLRANRYSASSGTWGTAATLETSTVSSYVNCQVAMDGNGNAMAVWASSNATSPQDSIYARHWSGGAWGASTVIDRSEVEATVPQVAMSSNGEATAVWVQSDGTYDSVFASRFSSGAWGAPAAFDAGAGAATSPQVAMDATGDARVVWVQSDGSADSIYSNRFTAGSWEAAVPLESRESPAYSPMAAMDLAGNCVAIWTQNDGSFESIYYNLWLAPFELTISTPASGATVYTPTVLVAGTTMPDTTLVINGVLVAVNEDGTYAVVLALLEGANTITVTATSEFWGTTISESVSVTFVDRVQGLEESLANTDANVTALGLQLSAVMNDLDGAIVRLDQTNALLIAAYAQSNATQGQLNACWSDLNSTKALLTASRTWLQSVDEQLASCWASGNVTAEQLSGLEGQVSAVEALLINLRDSIQSTDGNVTDLSDRYDGILAMIQQTNAQLTTAYDAGNLTAAQLADLANAVTALESSITNIQESLEYADVSAINAEFDNVSARIQAINDLLTNAYADGNITADQLASLTAYVAAMETMMLDLQDSLASTDTNVTETRTGLGLSDADRSTISALLNDTIADLQETKEGLAQAQSSIKAQGTPTDGTTPLVVGVVGIVLAVIAIALAIVRTRKK